MAITSVIGFLFLFFILVMFLIQIVILVNIYTKSYHPLSATMFTAVILVLFISFSWFAYSNYRSFVEKINTPTDQLINPTPIPKTQQNGSGLF